MRKRHIHQWRELLPRGDYEHTTFVTCDKCKEQGRQSVKYLNARATAEFRWQIKHHIKPRFARDGLVPIRPQKNKRPIGPESNCHG